MANVCFASICHVDLSRLICAVDLDPMGLGPMGRCGLDAKEQENGRQWDVEN